MLIKIPIEILPESETARFGGGGSVIILGTMLVAMILAMMVMGLFRSAFPVPVAYVAAILKFLLAADVLGLLIAFWLIGGRGAFGQAYVPGIFALAVFSVLVFVAIARVGRARIARARMLSSLESRRLSS